MSPEEREFAEMIVALARTVRRGRSTRPALAKVAADWEARIQADLDEGPQLSLLAAEPRPEYRVGDSKSHGGAT